MFNRHLLPSRSDRKGTGRDRMSFDEDIGLCRYDERPEAFGRVRG